MKTRIPFNSVAALASALALGASLAYAAPELPSTQYSGPVAYLSGGVGEAEASAIKAASKNWPLTLEFAIKTAGGAEYAANVNVKLTDAQGRTTLDTRSEGPFLLAQLAPGSYRVEATLDGKTLHEQVVVKPGQPTKAVLVWPAGTDQSA